jgi:hypothetical protein
MTRHHKIFEEMLGQMELPWLHWVVQFKTDLDTLDHYLDDFIFAGANGSGNCALLMDVFKNICQELGVPLADNKTVGPTTLLTFLGLLINPQ